jgi:ankyrin repeat protein
MRRGHRFLSLSLWPAHVLHLFDMSDAAELWDAAQKGDVRAVRELAPLTLSSEYAPALLIAAINDHVPVLTALSARSANFDQCTRAADGWDVGLLHNACLHGSIGAVHWLIDRGADVNRRSAGLDAPLEAASYNGHLEVVQLLLERGAGASTLCMMHAVEGGHVDVVLVLAGAKCDVEALAQDDRTPLTAAAARGHVDVIRALVQCKADVNRPDEPDLYGMTPLCTAALNGHVHAIRALVEAQAGVNVRCPRGLTPLVYAMGPGNADALGNGPVLELLRLKADPRPP